MGDLSNKSLALLLLAAMVVSLGGTFLVLNKNSSMPTGYASSTGTGTVQLSVASTLSITTADNNAIDFGTCTPASGAGVVANVTSDILENTTAICTMSTLDNISVRNDGNINVTVKLQTSACAPGSGNTSCTFMNSSNRTGLFMYKTLMGGGSGANGNYANGCVSGLISAYTSFAGTHSGAYVGCGKLLYGTTNNSFVTHYKIGIPSDMAVGAPSVTITYTASVNSS